MLRGTSYVCVRVNFNNGQTSFGQYNLDLIKYKNITMSVLYRNALY